MTAGNQPDMQALVDALNEDLAHEYQAVIAYNTYAAMVSGMNRVELKGFFASEIPDELRHAQFLADKITALGGTPTTMPAEVATANEPRAMLEQALKYERETIPRYVDRMKQAEAVGDYGLANDLQDMISDETGHKEELEKLLRRTSD
jgi:bacterioferritin